jgi:hypothetical protein
VPQEPFKAIAIVVVVGLMIGGVGVGALLLAFRAFGENAPRSARPVAILGMLTAFILLACAVLFAFSFFGGGG